MPKNLQPAPVRSVLAGYIVARLFRMGGAGRFGIKPGQLNKVLSEYDLDALSLWSSVAIAGPDAQMIYHMRKAGLIDGPQSNG